METSTESVLIYLLVLISYFLFGIVFVSIIIYLIRCFYKKKYLGKPFPLEVGLHIKFIDIIQEDNEKLTFSAHPIFMGQKRSLRYFSVEKCYLKNPITITQTLSPAMYYRVKKDENDRLFLEKIEITRKFEYYE